MRKSSAAETALVLLLAACGAPGYRPSEVPVPATFRETAADTAPARAQVPPPAAPADSARVPADSARVPAAVPSAPRSEVTVDQTAFWRALGDTTLEPPHG